MAVKFANNVSTTLSAAINATQTTISVADASGLPTLSSGDYVYLTLDTDTNSPTIEVVKVTGVSTNTLTVVRGQDGTTASSFSNGTKIELRVTAAALDDIAEKAQTAAETESVSRAGDTITGTLNFTSAANPLISSQYGEVLWHDDQFSQDLIKQVFVNGIGDYLQLRAGGNGPNVEHKFGETYADLGGYLKIGGTTRIDSSGNATLGTVSSGSITTTGTLALTDDTAIAWGSGSSRPAIIGNTVDDDLDIYILGNSIVNVDASGIDVTGTLSSGAITSSGTGTFEGGGNTLLLKKGTGTPAIAFAGTASDPQTTALIEGISNGGLKIYTSSGTISAPSWSPKFTLAANGNVTLSGTLTSGAITAAGTIKLLASAGSGDSLILDYVGDDLDVRSGTGTYAGRIRANSYKIGTTTVIDSSRNATFSALNISGDFTMAGYDLMYTGGGNFDIKHTTANQDILFYTKPTGGQVTERVRIGSTGVVKVTNSSWAELHLDGGPGGDIILKDNGVNIGEIYAGAGHGMVLKAHSGHSMHFLTNGVATARAVIDTSGNFLAGKTSTGFGTAGVELAQSGTAGKVWMTRSGGEPLALNRLSSDGPIIDLFRDGSSVGTIGGNLGRFYIHNNYGAGAGLRFDNGSIRPSTSTGGNEDATTDLGASTVRWRNLYLSGSINSGTITSTGNIVGVGINSTANYTELGSTSSSNLVFKRNNASYIQADHSSGYFIFITGGRSTSYANRALALTTDNSANFGGSIEVSGGQIFLGTADSSSGHINAYELMTFNVDTDNDDTNRYFKWTTNGNSGSGTQLMYLDESGNLTVTGNFTVQGTTTTLNTATLQVEDKNIVLNYGTGDTSGSADGAGITIQDAINSSTDATILWNSSSDRFNFSHKVNVAGDVSGYNFYGQDHYVLNAAASGWHKWAERANNKVNLNVNTITSGVITVDGGTNQSVIKSSSDAPLIVESTDAYSGINFKDTGGSSSMFYHGASDHLYLHSAKFSVAGYTLATGYQFQVNGAAKFTGNINVGGTITTGGDLTIGGTGGIFTPEYIYHAGDNDTHFGFNANDSWRVVTGNQERIKANNGEVVINDSSADMNFRVESNNQPNMLVVDGGTDTVNIGTTSGGGYLNVVRNAASAFSATFKQQHTSGYGVSLDSTSGYQAFIYHAGAYTGSIETASNYIKYLSASSADLKIQAGGTREVVINDDGANTDFRVESNSRSYALFVDASADGVGIGNDVVEYMLDVGSDGGAYVGGRTMRINSSGDTIFSLSRAGTSLFSMRNNNVHYTALSSNNGADLMLGYGSGDAGAINDHLLFKASETVFNDSSANRDFRVESDTQTHALYVKGATGYVGVGRSDPEYALDVKGAALARFVSTGGDALVRIIANNYATESDARLFLGEADSYGMTFEYDGVSNIGYIGMNDNVAPSGSYSKRIQFSRSGTETAFMAGNVGIGVSSPAYKLQVNGSGTVARFTDGTSHMDLYAGSNLNEIATASPLLLSVGGTERMRIDSSGRVGIGVTPSSGVQLEVGNSTNSSAVSRVTNGTVSVDVTASTTGKVFLEVGTNHPLVFATNATERARITSTGDFLVGTLTSAPQNFSSGSGTQISDGYIAVARGGAVALLNRVSTDGDIVEFKKNGSTVGSIGTTGGDIYVGTGDTAIRFSDGGDQIRPATATGANRDAAVDLGKSDARFKDLYLSSVAQAAGGFSSDGVGKSYSWRAVANTGTSAGYVKIARITGSQSIRFIIELVGRSTSYGDGTLGAMGYIVGQLNNDNNYDIIYYNHLFGTGEVVSSVGQVDVDSTSTDIYVQVGNFSEVAARATVSHGTITPQSVFSSSQPSGFTSANSEARVFNSKTNITMDSGTSLVHAGTTVIDSNRRILAADGAANVPYITFAADTNTGIWRPGEDRLAISTGGGERLRIDNSGNLLFGQSTTTTPGSGNSTVGASIRAGGSSFFAVSQGPAQYLSRYSNEGAFQVFRYNNAEVGTIGVSGGNNLYITGTQANHAGLTFATDSVLPTRQSSTTNGVTDLGQSNNRFKDIWLSNGIQGTSTMYWSVPHTSGGALRLEFGNYNNTAKRTVQFYKDNVEPLASDTGLISLGQATNRFKNLFLSGGTYITGSVPRLQFNDSDGTNTQGEIRQLSDAIIIKSRNGTSNGVIRFNGENGTTESEYARFDASGNLLVAKNNTTFSNYGVELRAGNGGSRFIRSNAEPIFMNRTGSEGKVLGIYQAGAERGSLGVEHGDLFIESNISGENHSGIRFQATSLMPRSGGADADNTVDLGLSSHRWKNLHLSSAVRWHSGSTQKAYIQYDGTNLMHYGASGVGQEFYAGGAQALVISSSLNMFSKGMIVSRGGHSTARFHLEYRHTNTDSHQYNGDLLLWASEPGLTYDCCGIGGNIHPSGQYYGRADDNNAYGLYMRFDVNNGTTEWHSTTGSSGTAGGQGTKLMVLDSAGNLDLKTGGFLIGNTQIVNSSRQLQNVSANAGTGGLRHQHNGWIYDTANNARFYFSSGSHTFFGSQAGWKFQNSTGADVAEITNAGRLTVADGSESAPSIYFGSDTNTGFSHPPSADFIRVSNGGVRTVLFGPDDTFFYKESIFANGANTSITTPNITSAETGTTAGTTRYHINFTRSNGTSTGRIGGITSNYYATSYATSSDYRLKENVNYDWDATTRLKQLRPCQFNWIGDTTNALIDGFLAHEVEDIVEDAVVGEKDATSVVDGETVIDPQSIDQSKLVPLLVKTIQELEARIAALEAEATP